LAKNKGGGEAQIPARKYDRRRAFGFGGQQRAIVNFAAQAE
jgi:hypothetical protein